MLESVSVGKSWALRLRRSPTMLYELLGCGQRAGLSVVWVLMPKHPQILQDNGVLLMVFLPDAMSIPFYPKLLPNYFENDFVGQF